MEITNTGPMVRQLTPPDSPHSSDHALLPPIRTTWIDEKSKPSGKMSLDFIAPSSRSTSPESVQSAATLPRLEVLSAAAAMHRGSRPSSPFHPSASLHPPLTHSPHYSRGTKEEYFAPTLAPHTGLPSPVFSSYAEPQPIRDRHALHFNLSYRDHKPSIATYVPAANVRIPLYTPPGFCSPRVSKRSPKPMQSGGARAERHPYDAEERFALIYFRREDVEKKLDWKSVVERFLILFPRGAPRRYKSKDASDPRGLPPTYPDRNVQGLQCRLYRVRAEEGMRRTRDATANGGDTPATRAAIAEEMEAIESMITRHGLHPSFVRRVKQLAVKGDLSDVLARGHPRL